MKRLTSPHHIAIPVALLLAGNPSAAEPPVMPQGEAACAMGSEACAHSGNCPAMRHGMAGLSDAGGPWMRHMEELGLSGEQRQAIQAIVERFRDRGIELAQRSGGIKDDLLAVSPEDPRYADATRAAAESASRVAAQGVELASEMRVEVYAVLTPEQRQLARARATSDRQRWEDWRQRHRPPR
jgi:Spy/CpxP family protein refolding chaperone